MATQTDLSDLNIETNNNKKRLATGMGTRVQIIETLRFSLDAKSGALAEVYRAFQESDLNIRASLGFESNGEGQAIILADNTSLAQAILAQLGRTATLEKAVLIRGTDRMGAYADLLSKAANANINLRATDAISIGDEFATVMIASNQNEVSDLATALTASNS